MSRTRHRSKSTLQRTVAVLVVLIFASVGAYLLQGSHAASPYANIEAESGSLGGTASTQTASGASGGSYVQFGIASVISPITGVPAGITLGSSFENEFTAMSASEQALVMTQMKTAGVKWLRIDIYSIPGYSTLVKDAIASGINVDAILQSSSNTVTATPEASATFATQAVNYYEPVGVEVYEILNEPNGCEDTMDASTYTAILKASYTAIKAADPKAFVLTGGLCPAPGSNEPYTYLTAMYAAGAEGYFDAFNMHAYSYPDTPDQTTDSWNPWSYLPQLHSIMMSNGDGNKQIWITEFGCPTPTPPVANDCTDTTEAQQITDAYTEARTWPWIGPLLIFNWEDSADGNFGLYNADGTP